jgi:hypothetical protein
MELLEFTRSLEDRGSIGRSIHNHLPDPTSLPLMSNIHKALYGTKKAVPRNDSGLTGCISLAVEWLGVMATKSNPEP